MKITSLDHLVLTVKSVDRTVEFYQTVLGMTRQNFGKGRVALHFGSQKINLHPADALPDDNVLHPTPGSADLCFLTETPLDDVMEHLQKHGQKIIEGPIEPTGATGPLRSVYIYDPDKNLIEISNPL